LNLNYIHHLNHLSQVLSSYLGEFGKDRPQLDKPFEVGYSGHEFGLTTTILTVALGVTWIERHVTLDRTMWGSDHMASVEPAGMFKLIRGIREAEEALGGKPGPRILYPSELKKRETLRGA
jgi:sialic acid synthase SpsE